MHLWNQFTKVPKQSTPEGIKMYSNSHNNPRNVTPKNTKRTKTNWELFSMNSLICNISAMQYVY